MENLWIYSLLVIAVIAGWLLGRISAVKPLAKDRGTDEMLADYFVGLNLSLIHI